MNIENCYLKFQDEGENTIYISISEILDSGIPIDADSGNDLELVCSKIYHTNTRSDLE